MTIFVPVSHLQSSCLYLSLNYSDHQCTHPSHEQCPSLYPSLIYRAHICTRLQSSVAPNCTRIPSTVAVCVSASFYKSHLCTRLLSTVVIVIPVSNLQSSFVSVSHLVPIFKHLSENTNRSLSLIICHFLFRRN